MDYKQPIPSEFLCGVCKRPWKQPKSTPCKHTFCQDCISDMLFKKSECPDCSAPLQDSDLTETFAPLVSLADKTLLVYCPYRYAEPPCTAEIPRGEYEKHVATCAYEPKIQYLDTVSVDLVCAICHLPWTDPQETSCGHIFCKACLVKACQASGKPCPMCSTPFEFDALKLPSRPLLSMLDSLRVRCPYAAVAACDWTGRRDGVKTHVSERHTPLVVVPKPVPATQPTAVPSPAKPATAGTLELTSVCEFPAAKSNEKTALACMAHIKAPLKIGEVTRKPISVSAVIDVSGSMRGEKLNLVKETLKFVVGELSINDEIGLVAFDDNVKEALPLTKMDQEGKKRAIAAVESLRDGGSTNLSGGLFAGMDQIRGIPTAVDSSVSSVPGYANPTNSMKARKSPPSPPQPSLLTRMNNVLSGMFTKPTTYTLPANSNVSFSLTVSHTHSSLKRDGKLMQRYTFTVNIKDVTGNVGLNAAVRLITIKSADGKLNLTVPAEAGDALLNFEPIEGAAFADVTVTVVWNEELKGTEADSFKYSTAKSTGSQTTVHKANNAGRTSPQPAPAPSASSALRYVWLFTDGQANVGIQDPAQLTAATRDRLKGHPTEITGIFTFGFGKDHSAGLLQSIAESCQGSYYFIPDAQKIPEVFGDCLGGLLSVVAQNITLRLRIAPGATFKRLLTTLPSSGADGIAVTMKDLYSEEERDVLVQLELNPQPQHDKVPLVTWELTYTDAASNIVATVSSTTTVDVTDILPAGMKPNTELDQQRNRILTTEALEEARRAADAGNIEAARSKLKAWSSEMHASPSCGTAVTAQLETDVQRAMDAMESTQVWNSKGGKVVTQMANMHAMQRCNAMEDNDAYVTSAKVAMKSKASKK